MKSSPIKRDVLKFIEEKRVLSDSRVSAYTYDATRFSGVTPLLVVFPVKEEEVVQLMKYAYRHSIPVYPRGAGTGKSGGSVPVKKGIVIVLTLLNRIEKVDAHQQIVVAQAGVITKELKKEVSKIGFFYPPDPQSEDISTVGGNIATNAGGPRSLKYGTTSNYVQNLQIVLPDGTSVSSGKELKKFGMGFNFTPIFVGSEGSLGIIVKSTLQVLPLSKEEKNYLISFQELSEVQDIILKILTLSPSRLELLNREILVSFDDGRARFKEIKQITGDNSIEGIDEKKIKILEKRRKEMTSRLWKEKGGKLSIDVSLPLTRFSEFFDFLNTLKEEKISLFVYGHAGSGNLHTNLLFNPESREHQKIWELRKNIISRVIQLGGSASGEHGTGFLYSSFLKRELGKEFLNLQKRIKELIDPKNILNPGKIFDKGKTLSKLKSRYLKELPEITKSCTLCGMCIPVCPLYEENHREDISPRGFIFLYEKFLKGEINKLETPLKYVDFCFSCQKCWTSCPNEVDITSIFKKFRILSYSV